MFFSFFFFFYNIQFIHVFFLAAIFFSKVYSSLASPSSSSPLAVNMAISAPVLILPGDEKIKLILGFGVGVGFRGGVVLGLPLSSTSQASMASLTSFCVNLSPQVMRAWVSLGEKKNLIICLRVVGGGFEGVGVKVRFGRFLVTISKIQF